MKQIIFSLTVSILLSACASQPEIPAPKKETKRSPQTETTNRVPLKEWRKYLVATEIRAPETDCQVYNQPNLYSEKVDTAKAGKEVWTEDTGSSWYKVYKNKKYGYVSKICFTN